MAANGLGFAKVGGGDLSLAWPLKPRLAKAKLLKPGQNSYSRWAIFVSPTFAKLMLGVVLSRMSFKIFDIF